MDRQRSAKKYKWLRLFCNWVVHILLEHKNDVAKHLLKAFDEAVERRRRGDGDSLEFLSFLSVRHFRQELAVFLRDYRLPSSLVGDQNQWDYFLGLYSSVVSECPIMYGQPDYPFKNIKSLELTKAEPPSSYVIDLVGPGQSGVWMNWRVKLKDESVEWWPFYNI